MYIIWFQFNLFLSPFYYFDYYEHQYFTSVLFHMFSFIKNALFGSYSWMSHRTFIESSAVTTAFWLDQYGGRFASIFRRCPPSMFWGQWLRPLQDVFLGVIPQRSSAIPFFLCCFPWKAHPPPPHGSPIWSGSRGKAPVSMFRWEITIYVGVCGVKGQSPLNLYGFKYTTHAGNHWKGLNISILRLDVSILWRDIPYCVPHPWKIGHVPLSTIDWRPWLRKNETYIFSCWYPLFVRYHKW